MLIKRLVELLVNLCEILSISRNGVRRMSDYSFIEVAQARGRICDRFYCSVHCPIHPGNNKRGIKCLDFFLSYPKEAEEIIMKWAKEHPAKTLADKFEETFGFKVQNDCMGRRCPDGYYGVRTGKCPDYCENYSFWQQEYKENKG